VYLAKVTISIIKCDVGSLAGHYIVPKPLFHVAEKNLKKAAEEGVVNNFYVFNAGDLELLMVHEKGEQNPEIHKLAWNTFKECADRASQLKL
jgi:fructose 1,6-bisphosphate aldolase/phosphatase